MCLRIFLVGLAQERILTRTNVGQTAIVQLDVIIRTYEHATAVIRCRCDVLEVLQIDVVTLLFTITDTDVREFGDVCYLSQEEQATCHFLSVKRIAHIDITFASAEDGVAIVILEIERAARIHNDVAALACIHRQVTLIALILERLLGESSQVRCSSRANQFATIVRPIAFVSASAYAADDTRVLVSLISILAVVKQFSVHMCIADVLARVGNRNECRIFTRSDHIGFNACEVDVTTFHAWGHCHVRLRIVPTGFDIQHTRISGIIHFVLEQVIVKVFPVIRAWYHGSFYRVTHIDITLARVDIRRVFICVYTMELEGRRTNIIRSNHVRFCGTTNSRTLDLNKIIHVNITAYTVAICYS